MKSRLFIALAILLTTTLNMNAQLKQFTLEDLNFGGNRYYAMTPERRHYEWWGNKLVRLEVDKVSTVKGKPGSATAKSGNTAAEKNAEGNVLFTLEDVEQAITAEEERMGINLLNASFPYADRPLALIKIKGKRILYDFRKKSIAWSQDSKGTLEWNKDSKADAFLKEENLWLRLDDGTERQISNDGSREIVYAQSVHRNEFGINKGTFWAPDGQKIAFYRMDQTMVTDYPQVNTFTRIASHEPDKYPMAGMTSHEVTVGIHDLASGKTIYLDARKQEVPVSCDSVTREKLDSQVPCDSVASTKDRYFTNIQWAPDGKRIYLFELNRDQNVCTLDEYDAETGAFLRTIDTETDEKYVEPMHPIEFLPWDNSKFLMWSQRNGFWHLYLYDLKSGKCLKQITDGDYVVMELIGFCPSTKSVIIKANKENHLCHNIYSVSLSNDKMTLLDNGKGVHNARLSADGKLLIDTWSEPDLPRAYSLTATTKAGNKPSAKADDARKILFTAPDPWQGYAIPTFRQGTIKAADGTTDLHYRMVLPCDFDESKKYPTVVYVYGGPHAHLVEASWHWYSRSWETYMAQKGYIVFVLDNRGSEHRGKDFEQVTFRELGQKEMLDQIKGVEYISSLPYIDTNRLGVHGWSYGGYMTISLMTNYPDVFKVGVAGGPVIDWKWYEVMYGERYMDTPEQNPEGYEKTSLINKAANLKGRLQIIIGANDPVVVPQHAMQFVNECNETGSQPDFYIYPGEEHNMAGHKSVHLHERITRYFEDFLK